MSATVLTITLLSRLLAPAFKDLYDGAKGQVKQALEKLSTAAGTKKLATTLMKIDKVKTIWSAEDEVSLKKFYYPSKLGVGDQSLIISSIQELPEGNLIIQGIVGQGKSIFMRHLACSLLNTQAISEIPIFLELRNISPKRNLQAIIENYFKSVGIPENSETFDHLASSGKIILLLDGFDEIPEECITDIIVDIDSLQTRFSDLKIIISSRPQSSIQNLVGFRVLRLVPLIPEDYDPFVKKLIPSIDKRTDVVSALHSCPPNIKGIISTPLMLTLVIVVYQTEKEIPLSLAEFFDKLFGIVFTKHDKLKAGFNRQHHSGLSERQLRQLFDAFCFMAVQTGGGRSLTRSQFNKAFDHALKYAPECKCDIDCFRHDITKVACLLIEEGLDLTTFLHKSILDYHAAAFVKELPDVRAEIFYSAAATKYRRWQPVLSFLSVIDQPRFAKDYYLKTMVQAHTELFEVLNDSDESKLPDYINNLSFYPEVGIRDKSLTSWGISRTARNELEEEILSSLMNATMDMIHNAHDSEIEAAFKMSGSMIESKTKTQKIKLRDLLKVLNLDLLRNELRELEQQIFHNIENSRNIIEAESSKESAFEDILDSPPTPQARRKQKPATKK
ncbi:MULTISPECIES: NACHT domain-containing protein [unclassified Pseudomonas]|uniref:NACHT domain-containing protein n=1 Tax=unclassified Pseudomonas TaxID=196821 RepID=UPI001CBF5AED|nr:MULTISPECIES: NACHT domain-containing protein [unclassified Pseudomonas]